MSHYNEQEEHNEHVPVPGTLAQPCPFLYLFERPPPLCAPHPTPSPIALNSEEFGLPTSER